MGGPLQTDALQLIGALGSSLLLVMILSALWVRERAAHLWLWACSWAFSAGIRASLALRGPEPGFVLTDLPLALLYVGQAAFLIEGTRRYVGAPPARWPVSWAAIAVLVGLILHAIGVDPALAGLPVHLLLAVGFGWTGVEILRRSAFGMGGLMAGGGLLLLSPLALATVPLIATGADATVYVVERVLCLVIGLGIVFVHIDAAYDRIHRRDEMIEHVDEGLLQLDLEGHPVQANPALARLLGFDDVADLLSADLSPLVGLPARASVLNRPSDGEAQVQWQRRDGAPVWVALRIRPHRDHHGVHAGYHVHVRDTTEERSMAETLQRSEKLNALGQLAGGVAHDFNNVLAVVEASLDLAEGTADDPDRLERVLTRARNATARGAALTRRLLDFARHRPERLEVLDLHEVAAGSLALLERTLDPSIRLRLSGPGPAYVRGDRGQLERVLMNLILNARDALPDGGHIDVRIGRTADQVVLEVRDDGTGILPELQPHIFDPFFTTREGGTGLGLATVYGIVTGARGTIDVATDAAGTSFVVGLPAAEGPADAAQASDPAPPGRRRRTVLVADDEPDVRELAAEILADAGYRVLQARNGLEALEMARTNGYVDVLVTDVVMPQLSGGDLADAMQRNFPGLPVLFLSGYPDQLDTHLLAETSRRLLGKPFRRDELLACVSHALAQIDDDDDDDTTAHGEPPPPIGGS